jgi:hypothetical protein
MIEQAVEQGAHVADEAAAHELVQLERYRIAAGRRCLLQFNASSRQALQPELIERRPAHRLIRKDRYGARSD